MDANTTIAITGGSISIAGIVIGFVVWSLKRNVQHEDAGKVALTARCEANEKATTANEKAIAALRQELTEKLHASQLESRDASTKLSTLTGSIGELRGLVHQLGNTIELNRDKMSTFYRSELDKMVAQFDQKLEQLDGAARRKR